MRYQFGIIGMQRKKDIGKEDSPLEQLRIERTQLNQDQLAYKSGIPRATYMRWISGATEAKLTLPQLKSLCRELGIKTIDELPDSFKPSS